MRTLHDALYGKEIAQQKVCKKKRAFETQSKANRIGFLFNQRAYLCPVCHCWHLTSKRAEK